MLHGELRSCGKARSRKRSKKAWHGPHHIQSMNSLTHNLPLCTTKRDHGMSPTNEAGSSAGVEPPSPPPNESQEVSPSNGKLVHLKTRAEILTAHETGESSSSPWNYRS